MRIALSILSLIWSLVPAAAQTAAPPPRTEEIDTLDAEGPQEPGLSTPAHSAESAENAQNAASDGQADSARASAAVRDDSVPPASEAASLRAPLLSRLDLGGTVQLKALYHDMFADRDADKRLSFQLRRFQLELEGDLGPRFGFRGELRVEGGDESFGLDQAFLHYTVNELVGFKGGKLRRPFSREALQSPGSLYTVERGGLYHDFLARTTGYASFDLGVAAYGGFEDDGLPLGYELGLFNGRQSGPAGGYGDDREDLDPGFKAKDLVFRITASPLARLNLEAAVSTKAAEDASDAFNFAYAVNTAYQVGADLALGRLRLQGEIAWGDDHKGLDSLIVDGGAFFFAFYAMGVWREDYARGRASELVLKLEGLDPDFEPGSEGGAPNDGKLRYTLGMNYFFTPRVGVMADYGILQPITRVEGEDGLTHDLDILWRMSF